MLTYEEAPPPVELKPFVRCFWTLRGAGDPQRIDRIFPDGSFELVFHRGDVFRRDGQPQPRAMLIGEIRRPTLVASSGHADVFGIRFRLGGFGALTGLDPVEVRDGIHDVRDVFREDDPDAMIRMLVSRRSEAIDRRLFAAVAMTVHSSGRMPIAKIATQIGATERTLERLFDRFVGLRPKELSRLTRFQASLRGVDDGYYDESHRIHEYREFAGTTPSVVAAEQSEITSAFVGNLQDDAAASRR
jgi:AraC-like DNA-binding protein